MAPGLLLEQDRAWLWVSVVWSALKSFVKGKLVIASGPKLFINQTD